MNKKQKKWWQYLLSIPAVLILDVVIMLMALFFDGAWVRDVDYGHGMPVFTIISGIIMAVITLVTVIKAIVKAIGSVKQKDDENHVAEKKPTYVPVIVSLIVSAAALYFCGKYEIESFYTDPQHVGFAVPIVTFFLAVILLVVNLIVIFITHKVNKKRRGH